METRNLPDRKFKTPIIRMFNKFWGRVDDLSENFNKKIGNIKSWGRKHNNSQKGRIYSVSAKVQVSDKKELEASGLKVRGTQYILNWLNKQATWR